MKQILLKTGLLLFCYTLIISNHIEKSKYFVIKKGKGYDYSDYNYFNRRNIIPINEFIPKENYLNHLTTYDYYIKQLVLRDSTEKILPFENRNNLWLTIFFLISVTIIIVSIDINDKSVVNKKVLLLSIPLLFYFFQSFNISNQIPLTVTNADTESDISIIKRDINNLESNQSDLKGRVNDLEY